MNVKDYLLQEEFTLNKSGNVIAYFDNGETAFNLNIMLEEYAKLKSKHYAKWLSNQVVAGRTSDKLYSDYLLEH